MVRHMTDKKALKIIKRYIELKIKVKERRFPITPLQYDSYMLIRNEFKKIKKEYKEAENKLKKDFEVLKILKSHFYKIEDGCRIDTIFLDIEQCDETDREECRKIKEWLENE